MTTLIEAKDLGIEFTRNKKRRLSLREILLKGQNTTPQGRFWALRNISFAVQAGEAVGLLGANGCGKSTLLKLMAGVMLPDEGDVGVHAGVAPLIELTGGFVGDLTARDNIWLAAGLHGLTKAEIEERFDEIVDFAEIGDFLDTPFRHFSSGMQVRLGFSVVTQLDEPIILVDEVLAVGDKRFRRSATSGWTRSSPRARPCSWSRTARTTCAASAPAASTCAGEMIVDGPIEDALEAYNVDIGRTA